MLVHFFKYIHNPTLFWLFTCSLGVRAGDYFGLDLLYDSTYSNFTVMTDLDLSASFSVHLSLDSKIWVQYYPFHSISLTLYQVEVNFEVEATPITQVVNKYLLIRLKYDTFDTVLDIG